MPFEHFLGRMMVKVTGASKCLNILGLYGPELVHLCMDFKIILHSCCPRGGKVPFETFFRFGFFVKKILSA